jgi:tetratricopeptide (TPR) repeat protein
VYWEKAFAMQSVLYGKEPHPDVATSHYCLGLAYEHSDKPRATAHYKLALALNLTLYPNIDSNQAKYLDISAIYNNLGNIHFDSECFQEALPYYWEDLRICQTVYGETTHLDTAGSHYNLGKAYQGLGDLPAAHTHFKNALSLYQQLGAQEKINEITRLLTALQLSISTNALIAAKAQDRQRTQKFEAAALTDFGQGSDGPTPAIEENDEGDELTYV